MRATGTQASLQERRVERLKFMRRVIPICLKYRFMVRLILLFGSDFWNFSVSFCIIL
jgi:hypothetical protein